MKTYEDGLNDAWKCARKIFVPVNKGGLSGEEVIQIFNSAAPYKIFDNYSALEAITKIKEHEKKNHDCEHCSKTYGTLGCCDMVNNEWVYSCEEGHKEYERTQKQDNEIKFGDILESYVNGYKYIALRVIADGYVICVDQYGRASTQHKGGFKIIEHNPQIENVFEKIREVDE